LPPYFAGQACAISGFVGDLSMRGSAPGDADRADQQWYAVDATPALSLQLIEAAGLTPHT